MSSNKPRNILKTCLVGLTFLYFPRCCLCVCFGPASLGGSAFSADQFIYCSSLVWCLGGGGGHREVAHGCCHGAVWSCSQTAKSIALHLYTLYISVSRNLDRLWLPFDYLSGSEWFCLTLHYVTLPATELCELEDVMKGEAKGMDGQELLVMWYANFV